MVKKGMSERCRAAGVLPRESSGGGVQLYRWRARVVMLVTFCSPNITKSAGWQAKARCRLSSVKLPVFIVVVILQ